MCKGCRSKLTTVALAVCSKWLGGLLTFVRSSVSKSSLFLMRNALVCDLWWCGAKSFGQHGETLAICSFS